MSLLADSSDTGPAVVAPTRFGDFASKLALERMFELSQQATSWVMKYTGEEVLQIRQRVEA